MGQIPALRVDTLPLRLGIKSSISAEEVVAAWKQPPNSAAGKALATERMHLGEVKATHALDYLRMVIDGGNSPVIWTWHREPCEKLSKYLGIPYLHGGLSPEGRRDALASFTSGSAPAIVMTIPAASEGIDGLQHRTDLCIFVERSFVPKDQEQAIGRLHRIGQHNPVRVTVVESDHPIDRGIAMSLNRKESDIAEVIG
jgi:hypothetical protein